MENSCQRFLSLSIEALPALARHDRDDIAGKGSAPRVWEAADSEFGRGVLWLGRAVSDLLTAGNAGAAHNCPPADAAAPRSWKQFVGI
jgi:hypothetical protein